MADSRVLASTRTEVSGGGNLSQRSHGFTPVAPFEGSPLGSPISQYPNAEAERRSDHTMEFEG